MHCELDAHTLVMVNWKAFCAHRNFLKHLKIASSSFSSISVFYFVFYPLLFPFSHSLIHIKWSGVGRPVKRAQPPAIIKPSVACLWQNLPEPAWMVENREGNECAVAQRK